MNDDEVFFGLMVAGAIIFGYVVVKMDSITKELKEIRRKVEEIEARLGTG